MTTDADVKAAIAEALRRDAQRGDATARAWLQELQACRPRRVRVR